MVTAFSGCLLEYCVQLSVYSTLVAVAIATGFSLGSEGTTIQHDLQLSDCELHLKDLLFHLIWFVVTVFVHANESISLLP